MKSVVVRNPEILSGTPVFAGTRVPVKNLTDYLEGGSIHLCESVSICVYLWLNCLVRLRALTW